MTGESHLVADRWSSWLEVELGRPLTLTWCKCMWHKQQITRLSPWENEGTPGIPIKPNCGCMSASSEVVH